VNFAKYALTSPYAAFPDQLSSFFGRVMYKANEFCSFVVNLLSACLTFMSCTQPHNLPTGPLIFNYRSSNLLWQQL